MYKRRNYFKRILLLSSFFLFILLLSACSPQVKEEPEDEAIENQVHQLEIPEEQFRKVIGWLNDDEILVHTGDEKKEELVRFNIFTGEMTSVYSEEMYLLYVGISPNRQRVLIQKAEEDRTSLSILSIAGDVIQEREIETHGYVTADWNPDNSSLVLVAYHQETETDEEVIVENWNIEDNTFTMMDTPSLNVQWYSANLYLYVDSQDEDKGETGNLYVGDLRSDEKLKINADVASFYLHEDTFITFAHSDFSKGHILLTYEYPFMVEKGFVTLPSLTLSDRLILPHLSQGKRDSKVYAVVPKRTIRLEDETGEFHLAELDFENQKIHEMMDLPDTAPLSVADNEEYSLYGWQFEYIINLKEQTLIPLLPKQG